MSTAPGVTRELALVLAETLETTLNHVLAHDPDTLARFGMLTGQVIAIELDGVVIAGETLRVYLLPHARGVQILTHHHVNADTVLRGTPLALAGMSLERDGLRRLFSGEVAISGDIELGQRFKRILDGLDIDWEEWLAHYSGDTVAYRTGRLLRRGRQWLGETGTALSRDVSEYLRYEAAVLVDRVSIDSFFDDIDRTHSDVDRLSARIMRLERGAKATADAPEDQADC